MKFLSVKAYNTKIRKEITFCIAVDKEHKIKRIREILKNVHPEYKDLIFKKIKKPSDWSIFEH